jgi:hypothetical protein
LGGIDWGGRNDRMSHDWHDARFPVRNPVLAQIKGANKAPNRGTNFNHQSREHISSNKEAFVRQICDTK